MFKKGFEIKCLKSLGDDNDSDRQKVVNADYVIIARMFKFNTRKSIIMIKQ